MTILTKRELLNMMEEKQIQCNIGDINKQMAFLQPSFKRKRKKIKVKKEVLEKIRQATKHRKIAANLLYAGIQCV